MPNEVTELITKVLDVSSDGEDITTGLWDKSLDAYICTGILKNVNKVEIEKGDNLALHSQKGELIPETTLRPVADINDEGVRALFKSADASGLDNAEVPRESSSPKIEILKIANVEQQLVTGIVLQPETKDAHGDVISAEEIENSAHDFMIKSRVIGEQHKSLAQSNVVESYIAPIEMTIGDNQVIKKGTWLMTTKVHDTDLWARIKTGEITGFSPGGHGKKQNVA